MINGFLEELLLSNSVSGSETEIQKKIYAHMGQYADTVSVDEMGSVTAAVNPAADFRVLLAGHADEIGLMVTYITPGGFLKVSGVGGVYATCFPGHKVRIHTKNGMIYGAVVNTRRLSKQEDLKPSDLTIDIGVDSEEEAQRLVSVGDTVNFDTDFRLLQNGRITGRALDDRVGAYIVMEALKRAKDMGVAVGAYAAATTGEETCGSGAYFTASRVKPRFAIAVDVTYATDYPGASESETGLIRLGKGPVICHSPAVNRQLNELLASAAEKAGIAVQYEVAGGRTGTDGDQMFKTGMGVPFALISIPLRYMHSPDETGCLQDIEDCANLLAQFLHDCTEDTTLKPF